MPTRTANARWTGGLTEGRGELETGSGLVKGVYNFSGRFEEGSGTNPEELMGAAHAGCYAMAFSALLGEEGYTPETLDADASVTLEEVDGKPTITRVAITVKGNVPGLSDDDFRRIAEATKDFCPVSRALAGVEITLDVKTGG